MKLTKNTGMQVAVLRGRAMLSAKYTEGDAGPGTLELELEDASTLESTSIRLWLDPWLAEVYQVHEWPEREAVVICGADDVIALHLAPLRIGSVVGLEYEEAETLEHPWIVSSPGGDLLIVATERRVWCLDDRLAIRWMWPVRTSDRDRWIHDAPRFHGDEVHVPVRTRHAEAIIHLSIGDGIEHRLARF